VIKWPNRNRSKGNVVEIALQPDDTYDMTFYNGTKVVKAYHSVYADQLRELFEKQTGWFLSIGRPQRESVASDEPGAFDGQLSEMVWGSLRDVQASTKSEFVPALAGRHFFVELPSGKWSRTLDAPPKGAVHVRGRIYKIEKESPSGKEWWESACESSGAFGEVVLEDIGFDLAEAKGKGSYYEVDPEFVELHRGDMKDTIVKGVESEVNKALVARRDVVYVADDAGLLAAPDVMSAIKSMLNATVGRGEWKLDKIKSPRTGRPGWRITCTGDDEEEAVPGGTQKVATKAFLLLAKALPKAVLKTLAGVVRQGVDSDEFMLMQILKDGKAMFKHRTTRNYVMLDLNTGKLDVPVTNKNFFRGYFDESDDADPTDDGVVCEASINLGDSSFASSSGAYLPNVPSAQQKAFEVAIRKLQKVKWERDVRPGGGKPSWARWVGVPVKVKSSKINNLGSSFQVLVKELAKRAGYKHPEEYRVNLSPSMFGVYQTWVGDPVSAGLGDVSENENATKEEAPPVGGASKVGHDGLLGGDAETIGEGGGGDKKTWTVSIKSAGQEKYIGKVDATPAEVKKAFPRSTITGNHVLVFSESLEEADGGDKRMAGLVFKIIDMRGQKGFPEGDEGLVYHLKVEYKLKERYTGTEKKWKRQYLIRTDHKNQGWRVDDYGIGPSTPVDGIEGYYKTPEVAAKKLAAYLKGVQDKGVYVESIGGGHPREAAPDDVLEYEVYVDKDGYAHDDEGNREYVGRGRSGYYGGTSFAASGRGRMSGRSSSGWVDRTKEVPPTKEEQAMLDALKDEAEATKSSFMLSIYNQFRDAVRDHRGPVALSPKQKAAVVNALEKRGKYDEAKLFGGKGKPAAADADASGKVRVELLDKVLSRRPNDFLASIRDQIKAGRKLTDKQLSAVRHNLYKLGMKADADTFRE
jgi:hypothetical protein